VGHVCNRGYSSKSGQVIMCLKMSGRRSALKKPLAGAQKHIPGMPAWAAQDSGKGGGYFW